MFFHWPSHTTLLFLVYTHGWLLIKYFKPYCSHLHPFTAFCVEHVKDTTIIILKAPSFTWIKGELVGCILMYDSQGAPWWLSGQRCISQCLQGPFLHVIPPLSVPMFPVCQLYNKGKCPLKGLVLVNEALLWIVKSECHEGSVSLTSTHIHVNVKMWVQRNCFIFVPLLVWFQR